VWPDSSPGSGGEVIFLGVHESGAEVLLEAFDQDTGLEGSDDPIGKVGGALPLRMCWSARGGPAVSRAFGSFLSAAACRR